MKKNIFVQIKFKEVFLVKKLDLKNYYIFPYCIESLDKNINIKYEISSINATDYSALSIILPDTHACSQIMINPDFENNLIRTLDILVILRKINSRNSYLQMKIKKKRIIRIEDDTQEIILFCRNSLKKDYKGEIILRFIED